MEGISPSPVESGILTEGPSSHQPDSSDTINSLSSNGDLTIHTWKTLREPRNRLESLSVCDLKEFRAPCQRQIHYPSAPNIPESYSRRNAPQIIDLNRKAPPEEQLFLDNPRKTGDKERKKSLCQPSVKILLWLTCSFVVVFIVAAVLLGCLLPRNVENGPSSCAPPCAESWIWVSGRCYYFSDGSKDWNESLEFCTTHNSTLAMLIDQDIKKTIERYRENVNYWIGLSMNHNDKWVWTNGSLYDGSLDNHNSDRLRCAYLNSHLGALDCSTGRQWICVKDST